MTSDLDPRIKLLVYRHFADTGSAPTVEAIAARAGTSQAHVREAFARLRRDRVLWLEPDGVTIRMAPPFSGVPTQHRVRARDRDYFANCAWDALGIVAALGAEGTVRSECGQSGAPLRLEVSPEGPEPCDWVFHCLVPAAQWWDDLVFT